MNPRTTALLLFAVLGLGAFLYFYELGGEGGRQDAEERGKRLFTGIEGGDVTWIALHTTDGADARFELHDGKWSLVAPLAFPADAGLARMADALATLTREKTLDHPQSDAEYGLDDANAKIVRFGAGGSEHELRIGAATPMGANVYVRTGDSPAVHTIASYHVTAFAKTLADLRDKQIVAFDPSAIGEVEVRWPGGRVVVARAPDKPKAEAKPDEPAPVEPEGEWQMSVPLAARADGGAIDNLLSTLSFLRADAFVDAPTDAQRKLLAPADFEVVLKNRDAKQPPLSLAIGRPDGRASARLGRGPRGPVRDRGDAHLRLPAQRGGLSRAPPRALPADRRATARLLLPREERRSGRDPRRAQRRVGLDLEPGEVRRGQARRRGVGAVAAPGRGHHRGVDG
jgi:hypothetical protein